jgi:nucleotide-binding universal stress UspA family protein
MKILICSDGSEQAERAMRLGAAVAAGCHADVTLFGILESAGDSKSLLESLGRGQALLGDKKISAELITKSGDPIDEIIRRTEEATYDLVVIGAVRKEARGAFWMSSKSYQIIKRIKPAVLSVAGTNVKIGRILICSGGKRYIDGAVRLAGEIARGIGASAALLHVLPEAPAIYAHLSRVEEDVDWLLHSHSELGVNLQTEKEALEKLGVKTEVILRHGGVLDQILREIHAGSYDLVVTGSALSRGLRTYVLGDVTREIVNRINCAVLVVRSGERPVVPRFRLGSLFGRSDRSSPSS